MSSWTISAIGVAVGLLVAWLLLRKSVQRADLGGDVPSRTPVVAAPVLAAPLVDPPSMPSPELDRLNKMQAAGTITQVEYDVLRGRLGELPLDAGDVSTLTITAGTRNKINDIKAIRAAVHLDLKDAKDVADRVAEGTPQVIARNLPRSEVVRLQQILLSAGLQVQVS